MQLKDILITFLIIQLCIFLYYTPSTVRYLLNIFNHFPDPLEFFQYFNQFISLGMNLIAITGVVLYFATKNIYNRFLKIYLIHHTFTLIAFLPSRIMWILDDSVNATIWYYHLFYLVSLIIGGLAIAVYAKQKVKVLPGPVSSKGVRFAHYVIDAVYLNINTFALISTYSMRSRLGSGDFLGGAGYEVFAIIISLMVPFLYYTISEGAFKQSIGKVITGSYVRSSNGKPAGFANIIGRSLCRYIPFEQFSFLTDPMAKWHDKISGTDVFYKSDVVFDEADPIIDHLISEDDFVDS